MVYLIGTKHEFQHNGRGSVDENLRKEFVTYLESVAQKYNATLIAEEFSEESLRKSEATTDIAKHVADKLSIRHLLCDPNAEDRKNIGIPSCDEIGKALGLKAGLNHEEVKLLDAEKRKYFPAREKFWLNKIEKYIDEIIIFVCGQDHIVSFESLLVSNGCTTKVLGSYL